MSVQLIMNKIIRAPLQWLLLGAIAMAGDSAVAADDIGLAIKAARDYRQAHEKEIVQSYMDLLALPNYAGDAPDIRRNAEAIVELLRASGLPARILEAEGSNPAVFAEYITPMATRTITFYIHYDGQPTNEEEWATPPFQPVLRSGRLEDGAEILPLADQTPPFNPDWRIYARSAGDDKAPIIAMISAFKALINAQKGLSANFKFFFDGEEEIGSPNLKTMIETHRDLLRSDLWLFLDGPVDQRGQSSITFGVRGVTGVDLTVYGPSRGLHSGHYGNFAPNPMAQLAHLLASMRDEQGRVLINGFYDKVREPSASDKKLIARTPSQDESLMKDIGVAEKEMAGTRYEEGLLWPALNFKGFRAGDVGDKAKNMIMPSAQASIGFRLVPEQSIARLQRIVEQHIQQQGYRIINEEPTLRQRNSMPRLIRVQWENAGYPAARTPTSHPAANHLISVMDRITNGDVIVTPSLGGSLPLAVITDSLKVPIAILPIANHDNNQHAPNENMRLGHLWRGIEIYAAILVNVGFY